MKFILTADWHPGIKALTDRLKIELTSGQHVLWLLSGGSNVIASVTVMQALPAEITANLTIILGDERYGVVGHSDSNEYQLQAAGFDIKNATFLQVLRPNSSFEVTRSSYERLIEQAIAKASIVIGQFGIGTDGHIAGILPRSPAVASTDYVCAYASTPYQRLTLTDHALKHVSAAYVLAYGTDKKTALELLSEKLIPYAEQPAQILKELPEAYVFNDQIGEAL